MTEKSKISCRLQQDGVSKVYNKGDGHLGELKEGWETSRWGTTSVENWVCLCICVQCKKRIIMWKNPELNYKQNLNKNYKLILFYGPGEEYGTIRNIDMEQEVK